MLITQTPWWAILDPAVEEIWDFKNLLQRREDMSMNSVWQKSRDFLQTDVDEFDLRREISATFNMQTTSPQPKVHVFSRGQET